MMDLVENTDDIDGPGNNAYLWWDEASGRFTVVPWDLNLAFGAMGGFGGGGGGGGGARPEGMPEGFDSENLPEGMPEGFDPENLPEGVPEGVEPGERPGRGAGGFGRGNVLVERFHENEDFEARYQAALATLGEELFAGGTVTSFLTGRAEVLGTSDLVDEATIEEESAAIEERITAAG